MINNSPFDDHIQKQFGNYKPEVPPHIWENIMAQKEKRRPGGFLFSLRGNRLLLLVLIFITAGAGILFFQTINKNDSNKQSSLNRQTGADPMVSKNQESNLQKNTGSANGDQQAKTADNTANLGRAEADGKVAVQDGEPRANKDGNNQNDAHTAIPKTNVPAAKNNVSGKHVTNAGNDNSMASANNRNKTKKSAAKQNMVIASPVAEADPASDEVKSADMDAINKEATLTKYYLDINTKPTEKTFSFTVTNLNIPAFNIPCPGLTKNNAANKRYLEVYAGPDFIFRTFNDTANSAYLQKRKESTHVSSAFSVGFRYTKVFNNAISFRTGLNYSQINETFKYEQGHMVQHVYNLGPAGDTIGSYATTGTRYKTTHNKYRTIDIPLMLGYEFGNGRLRTNIGAGLMINAYSWQKGDVLDSAYQPVNITTGKSNSPYQFKTNVGVGFTGSVSFYYKLTGNLHFLAEPYFRYNFSPANKADITLKQKYTTAGLRFGLRMDF